MSTNNALFMFFISLVVTVTTGCGGGVSSQTASPTPSGTLQGISVSPATPSIAASTLQQFTAIGTYTNPNSTQDITGIVTWSSSSTGVATIMNSGQAASVAAGTSTISASYGGRTGSTTLTVTPATLISIAITPANPSLAIGSTQQFTATGTFSDSTTQDLTTTTTWSSSSTGVATISNAIGSKGLVTAVAAGITTITGTSVSVSGTAALTVTGSGTVSLTWDAPTQYTDGSSLNPVVDLQSYKLYYGTASRTYTQVMTFTNPGTFSVTQSVTLASGTYFFVVTSVTQDNLESDYSNEVAKTTD